MAVPATSSAEKPAFNWFGYFMFSSNDALILKRAISVRGGARSKKVAHAPSK